ADAIMKTLRAQGIAAERVVTGEQMYDIPQLDERGYYEEFERAITGAHRYPGWPFRIAPGPARHHRTPAPTLGQHNDEILHGLNLSDGDIAALREARVIGDRALNT
ncbi:MAG TPA: CoA transferase, partial [Mycobacterium sp.]|nr:CoA transferase [Mycobacterium sp.]